MARNRYHVVPQDSGWAVRREGADRAASVHRTQGNAIEAGRDVAKNNASELVIHRPNGQIRDSDSYGHDPNPPRDQKH